MPRPVVVFLDAHAPPVRAAIAAECPPTVELRMATSPDPADRLVLARGAAFFVGGITPIPASLMDVAPGLRLIQKWGIGVDNVANVARHAFLNIQRVLDGHPLPEADLVSSETES